MWKFWGFLTGSALVAAPILLMLEQPVTAKPEAAEALPVASAEPQEAVIFEPDVLLQTEPAAVETFFVAETPQPATASPAAQTTDPAAKPVEPPVSVVQFDPQPPPLAEPEPENSESDTPPPAEPQPTRIADATPAAVQETVEEAVPDTAQREVEAAETAAAPTVKTQLIWSPFRTESGAQGFARRLSKTTGVPVRVAESTPGRYRVGFDYPDEIQKNWLLGQIQARTGLDFAADLVAHEGTEDNGHTDTNADIGPGPAAGEPNG